MAIVGSETANARVVPARYGPLNLATANPKIKPNTPATNVAATRAYAGGRPTLLVAKAATYAPTAINALWPKDN